MEQSDKFGNGPIKTRKVIWIVTAILLVAVICGLVMLGLFAKSKNSGNSNSNGSRSGDLNPNDNNGQNEYREFDCDPCAAYNSSYVVIEQTSGRILSCANHMQKMYPASTTKILTAICVLENYDLSEVIVVPKQATLQEGSSIYLKECEKWSVLDLLYGLMLRSGNDAAYTLANKIGVDEFVKLMNLTAIKAGAFYSNFTNPHGLHNQNHYTTAYDLAQITAYAYCNSQFVKIVSTQKHYYDYNGETRCFVNKNKLLGVFDGANGVKTGFTNASGRCLVFGAKRNGMQLISVVLNEPDMWQKSASIVQECFDKYSLVNVYPQSLEKQLTVGGKNVTATVGSDLYYPLAKSEIDALSYEYNIQNNIKNPKSGTVIGSVSIRLSNHLIFNEKIYTI